MTLRRRLIAMLVALVALGLTLSAGVSYRLYKHVEYGRLDAELHSSSPLLGQYLGHEYNPDGHPNNEPPLSDAISNGPIPVNLPPGGYVELRGPNGAVLAKSERQVECYPSDSSCPTKPPSLARILTGGPALASRTFTDLSGQYRVSIRAFGRPGGPPADPLFVGDSLVTAIPVAGLTDALHHLIVLELAVGAAVLVALSGGGLILLRRGLRPLERLAATAGAIAEGDLSRRTGYADRRTEVGQLGLAFNAMMVRIEQAFSDRDATEERLRQFLADASHELRTPLTSIRGYAELWHMGAASEGEELRTAMLRIEHHAVEMGALVEELLLLARLDQMRAPEQVPVDLTVLAAESLGDAAITAPDRRFLIDAPEPVTVVGDQSHLRQAVNNLLANAVRHTPDDSPIELGLHRGSEFALLTVRDHGPGLSPEGLRRAFDRFWRADTSRTGSGSGLGLAIVAAVTAEHGGSASVANAPDGGAIFTLRIPIAPTAASMPGPPSAFTSSPATAPTPATAPAPATAPSPASVASDSVGRDPVSSRLVRLGKIPGPR